MPKNDTSGGQSKRIRMRDVATRCGVSISTVSLVLSGDPRIPEDTTRKVLQAVKALEYRPSVVARNLARRSSRTIGVILPEYGFSRNQAFYYQALEGIHAQTQSAGYKIVVEAASPAFLERRYYLRLLKEQSADAMIYLAAGTNDHFLSEMTSEPYPFVLLASEVDGSGLVAVRGDDERGAKVATDHLISLGHKKIGHISAPKNISIGRDREKGFLSSAKDVEPVVKAGDFDLGKTKEATKELIQAGVTALFIASDGMAYAALRTLNELGKRVPEDVAVVGMDDIQMSEWVTPPLTTVRYDISHMAAQSAKYVINKIQSPLINKKMIGDIPEPKLIVRATCGGKN